MLKFRLILSCCVAVACLLVNQVRAENEGQATLDKAAEKKIAAENFQDLDEVIKLAEKAIKEGLDEANTQFAKSLLVSSRAQRGGALAKAVLDPRGRRDDRWIKLRAMAIADLEKVIDHDDKVPEVHLLIAQLNLLPAGSRERAEKAASKAIELATDDAMLRAKAHAIRGEILTNPEKQKADFDEAVKLASKDPSIYQARAKFFLLQRKPDDAIADAEKAIELDAEDVTNYKLKTVALLAGKKHEQALETLNKAIEIAQDEEHPVLMLQRVRIYNSLKKYDQAMNDLNELLEMSPDNAALLFYRAHVFDSMKKTDEAKADIEKAIKNKPSPQIIGAVLFVAEGDFSRAIQDLETILKITPKNNDIKLQLAGLHAVAKQPRKAIEYFDSVLEESPKNVQALHGRSDAYLLVGKHAEAIADYEAALKLNDRDQHVLNNYAWVLATSTDEKVHNAEKAVELAKQACELTDYKAPHILSTLAASYADKGDWDNALKWSEKAVELSKSPEFAEHADQLKKELESYKGKKAWREMTNEPDAVLGKPGEEKVEEKKDKASEKSEKKEDEKKAEEKKEKDEPKE